MNDTDKLYIIIGALCAFISIFFILPGIVEAQKELEDMREISLEDELNHVRLTEGNTVRPDRAAIVIADSIYLLKHYRICPISEEGVNQTDVFFLAHIRPPYHVSKKKGASKIIVVKDGARFEFCPNLVSNRP